MEEDEEMKKLSAMPIPERAEAIKSLLFQVGLFAEAVADLDLDGFLQQVGRMEVMGPIFNPTGYIQSADSMERNRRLVAALVPFQKEAQQQIGKN